MPIEIAGNGSIASIDAQVRVPTLTPTTPSPSAVTASPVVGLPATGGSPSDIVRWAMACLLVGAVLLLVRRRLPTGDRQAPRDGRSPPTAPEPRPAPTS